MRGLGFLDTVGGVLSTWGRPNPSKLRSGRAPTPLPRGGAVRWEGGGRKDEKRTKHEGHHGAPPSKLLSMISTIFHLFCEFGPAENRRCPGSRPRSPTLWLAPHTFGAAQKGVGGFVSQYKTAGSASHPFLGHDVDRPRVLKDDRGCALGGNNFKLFGKLVFFGGLGAPGGIGGHSAGWGAKPPTLWKGLRGHRGRPDPEYRRLPTGPKIQKNEKFVAEQRQVVK